MPVPCFDPKSQVPKGEAPGAPPFSEGVKNKIPAPGPPANKLAFLEERKIAEALIGGE